MYIILINSLTEKPSDNGGCQACRIRSFLGSKSASFFCVIKNNRFQILAEDSNMGAIVSEAQMNSILNYIEIGKQEGATLAAGGYRLVDEGLDKGFFIAPTVFTDVTPDMRIVQEEIFGPVVVIQKFKDVEEAIKLANDTDYGLAGGVFSNDGAKGLRVIKKVRAGITWVNDYHPTYVEAPWGGYKQNGIGRSLGKYDLDEYQEIKQININLDVKSVGWFPN